MSDTNSEALQQVIELMKSYRVVYEALSATEKKEAYMMVADIKQWIERGGLHGSN